MNTQVRDVGMVILGIVIIVSVFMSAQRVDKYLRIKAMSECGRIATYTYETNGSGEGGQATARTVEPNHGFYKICMEDMGYSTNIKE